MKTFKIFPITSPNRGNFDVLVGVFFDSDSEEYVIKHAFWDGSDYHEHFLNYATSLEAAQGYIEDISEKTLSYIVESLLETGSV